MTPVGYFAASYAIAAIAYGGLTVLLCLGWRRNSHGFAAIAAALLTVVWAILGVVASLGGPALAPALDIAELLRTGGWLVVLLTALRLFRAEQAGVWGAWWADPLGLIGLGLLTVGLIDAVVGDLGQAIGTDLGLFARLGLAVLGLVLVENLFAATEGAARWSFKHLLIGLGALFAFDLFLYSEALLFRQIGDITALARPLVNVFSIPLILVAAVRIRSLSFEVAISRQAVLQTTALIGSGAYLLGVAAIGYVLRETGLTWGPLLQILFFSGAILVLAVLLLSGELRARAKTFIGRQFFRFAYDYREEWLRFIRTMSKDDAVSDRSERAIQAIADVFECSSGGLFLRGRGDVYTRAALWTWTGIDLVALPAALSDRLRHCGPVIDLRHDLDADAAQAQAITSWLNRLADPWLLVPLRARDQVLGAILLCEPRAPRALTWEDHDLLDILGVQIGSYIAEEQATRALVEAQRFEHISKNFTFVAHDLKNLVSQLSLIVQQAERHGDNPAFQRDVLATVGQSVEKMRAMLIRLRETASAESDREIIDLRTLIRDVIDAKPALFGPLRRDLSPVALPVSLDRRGFDGVLENLLQNAIEATGSIARVTITCHSADGQAIVEVIDQGPGMSTDFIRQRLFQPFASSKTTGYGIGLYQSRELLERWHGRLEIDSVEGQGTTARIILPLAGGPAARPAGEDPDTAATARG